MKKQPLCDRILLCVLLASALAGCMDVLRAVHLGNLTLFTSVLIFDTLFLLAAAAAWQGRMPWLLVITAVAGSCFFYTTNFTTYEMQQPWMLVMTIAAGIGCIAGTWDVVKNKHSLRRIPWLPLGLALLVGIAFLGGWFVKTQAARNAAGAPRREVWAVPAQYDAPGCDQPGTVEELRYQTKAYATDSRPVEKRAQVYLPYGYDPAQCYNILYLMHGTGDDENYWLLTNPQNKDMLDRMIASGHIEPLIVVTPTFYTEDDCADSLDDLTFSFRQELRNDLMVAAESRYSTYAETADEAGFAASRDHRAFAGLSRGAVTTTHSALCGSLDEFSWFGIFSAFRTTEDYLHQTIQSEEFAELPIHYLYMTSGNYDFALLPQIRGYDMLLAMEPRLTQGVNTEFDVFPMRYHSIGSWHLALYNFLQRIF